MPVNPHPQGEVRRGEKVKKIFCALTVLVFCALWVQWVFVLGVGQGTLVFLADACILAAIATVLAMPVVTVIIWWPKRHPVNP